MADLRYDLDVWDEDDRLVSGSAGWTVSPVIQFLANQLGHTYRADKAWAALLPVLSAPGTVERVPVGNGWHATLTSREASDG